MNQKKGLELLKQLQQKKQTPGQQPKFNKNYGTQARIAAMHSIQRASGRRGN